MKTKSYSSMCFRMKALLTGILLVCTFTLITSKPHYRLGHSYWLPPYNGDEAPSRFFNLASYLPPKAPQVWSPPHVPVAIPNWSNSPPFYTVEGNPFIITPDLLNELDVVPSPRGKKFRFRFRFRRPRWRIRRPLWRRRRPLWRRRRPRKPRPKPAPQPDPAPAPEPPAPEPPAPQPAPDPAKSGTEAPAPAADEVSPHFFDVPLHFPSEAPIW